MMIAARISTTTATGPWHLFDEVLRNVARVLGGGVLPTRCGLDLPMSELALAQPGYDQRHDVVCGDCSRIEAMRLVGLANSLRDFGHRSRDGFCRHGVYVGGCGIDWMCGTCEMYSLDEEVAELRAAAALILRRAAVVEVPHA